MRRWVALAIGVGVGAAFLPYLGTRYEYVYAPILISTDVRNVVQEPDGDLCWDWTFVKVRRARPLGFHYSVTATNLAAKGTENPGSLARFSPAGAFASLSPTRNDT